jgi:cleavage and polyadenylation specificity factor subunit 1
MVAGAKPLRSLVEAVERFPPPFTLKQLQAFLGLVNFYHRPVPQAAQFPQAVDFCFEEVY